MTIVDILLHKWSYTDARRRQLLLGGLIFALIVLFTLAVLLNSGADDDNGAGGLVASADSSAVGSFRGSLLFADKAVPLTNLIKLLVAPSHENNNNSSSRRVTLKFANDIEIGARFTSSAKTNDDGSSEIYLEANLVVLDWHLGEPLEFGRCRLDGASLFAAPQGKHYLCALTKWYNCTASDQMSEDAKLVVDHFELELNRSPNAPSGRAETEPFSCT